MRPNSPGSEAAKSILWLSTGVERYGIRRNSIAFLLGLRDSGWDVCVLALESGPFVSDLISAGVNVEVVGSRAPRALRTGDLARRVLALMSWFVPLIIPRFWRIVWAQRRRRPAIVHVRVPSLIPVTAVIARLIGAVAVWQVPNAPGWHDRRKRFAYQTALRLGRINPIANSRSIASLFHPPAPVLGQALDAKRQDVTGEIWQQRRVRVAARTPLTYCQIGRICEAKAQDLVVNAFAAAAFGDGARLLVVGGPLGGEFVDRLMCSIRQLSLVGAVTMIGEVDEPLELLSDVDVVVGGQRYVEPFGVAILEAMSCGIPVIGFGAGGPEDLILDGTTGWFAGTTASIKSLRQAFVTAKETTHETRIAMGEAARERAVRHFSQPAMLTHYQYVVQELLACHR